MLHIFGPHIPSTMCGLFTSISWWCGVSGFEMLFLSSELKLVHTLRLPHVISFKSSGGQKIALSLSAL